MYEARDIGSFLIMLIVSPLAAFVLVLSLVWLAPFWLVYRIGKYLTRDYRGR
jgi:hypothetical protein